MARYACGFTWRVLGAGYRRELVWAARKYPPYQTCHRGYLYHAPGEELACEDALSIFSLADSKLITFYDVGSRPMLTYSDPNSQRSPDRAECRSGTRWISLGEAIIGSLIVFGHSVWHLLPNSVPLLFAMALISFRLREGSWTAMGLGLPKSWVRTAIIAVAAAIVQQAIGQFVVDPLTRPFMHYAAGANPMEGMHGSSGVFRWLGIIWTYAAFGEEIGYRGYLLNRVADLGGTFRHRSSLRFAMVEHHIWLRSLVSRSGWRSQ